MFINADGLAKFKELEKYGHTKVSSASEAASKDTIYGVSQDKEGNINLKSGEKVNIMDIISHINTLEQQGKGRPLR